ncbi:hypothetical protein [Paenibacillus terrae]|uniref:hypothetical protein n=1 Tax=Paenibacillus terrae TaxID=159743 RepID=UPI00165682DB|nr:hypothetical protein [Paenibacillus terrae]
MALQMGRIAVFLIVKTGSIGVYQVHTAVFLSLLQKRDKKALHTPILTCPSFSKRDEKPSLKELEEGYSSCKRCYSSSLLQRPIYNPAGELYSVPCAGV